MNPLSKETIELIEEKAEHPSVTSSILFIEVAHQVLTDPEILASVKGEEWGKEKQELLKQKMNLIKKVDELEEILIKNGIKKSAVSIDVSHNA